MLMIIYKRNERKKYTEATCFYEPNKCYDDDVCSSKHITKLQ